MSPTILRTISIPASADFHTLYQVTRAEWYALPTIRQGHFADLKFENQAFRVWWSRATLADYDGDAHAYAEEQLSFEQFIDGEWRPLDRYGRLVTQ